MLNSPYGDHPEDLVSGKQLQFVKIGDKQQQLAERLTANSSKQLKGQQQQRRIAEWLAANRQLVGPSPWRCRGAPLQLFVLRLVFVNSEVLNQHLVHVAKSNSTKCEHLRWGIFQPNLTTYTAAKSKKPAMYTYYTCIHQFWSLDESTNVVAMRSRIIDTGHQDGSRQHAQLITTKPKSWKISVTLPQSSRLRGLTKTGCAHMYIHVPNQK